MLLRVLLGTAMIVLSAFFFYWFCYYRLLKNLFTLGKEMFYLSVTFVNMNTTMKLKSMRWLMPSYYCYADAGDLDVSIESAWISLNVISIC